MNRFIKFNFVILFFSIPLTKFSVERRAMDIDIGTCGFFLFGLNLHVFVALAAALVGSFVLFLMNSSASSGVKFLDVSTFKIVDDVNLNASVLGKKHWFLFFAAALPVCLVLMVSILILRDYLGVIQVCTL